MSFPYMSPLVVQAGQELPASAGTGILASQEVVIFRPAAVCTLQACWACADATAAATSNLTTVFYNRGTDGAGTTILGTAGGSGSVWGATTPKTITLSNNTGIVADSYITALTTRIAASTASAWSLKFGFEVLYGTPATAN